MQATRSVEIWVGVFVALGLLALFFVAMEVSNLSEFSASRDSYRIQAHFGNIGGLKVRAQVSMAGVTVGRVERISFDEKNYEAVVDMRIEPAFKTLPTDTSASILTAGLLGEQYIGLSAGGSDDFLKDGDKIELTQSAMILEQLISKFLFNKAEEGKSEKKTAVAAKDTTAETVSASPATAPSDSSEDTAASADDKQTASKKTVKSKSRQKSPVNAPSVKAATHHKAKH